MKKLLVIFVLSAMSIICFAQTNQKDVVKLKNGSIVKGSVTNMIPNETITIVTADGSVFVYKMDEVEGISKEEIAVEQNTTETTAKENKNYYEMCSMATEDAKGNYFGKGSLSGATWVTTVLLSPIIGLIPAAIGSSSDVSFNKMNCPQPELYSNDMNYRNCYNNEVYHIKSKKAWTAWGVSTGVTIALYLVLFAL